MPSSRSSVPRHALVLAAGLGTRLHPLTAVRAKPAMPVAGRALISRILGSLASSGVQHIVVNLHHRPESIASVVGDGSELGVRVRYSWEQPVALGSAGGPRRALPLIDGDPFLIVNGDTLCHVDLGAMAAAHHEGGAAVTLALVPNAEPDRYGGVRMDEHGRVTGFVRRGPDARGSWHFVGIQIAARAVFAGLSPDRPAGTIGGIYDRCLADTPGSIRGFVSDTAFFDIGTPADYWRTCAALGHGVSATVGERTQVHQTADVRNSILWDDVTVEAGCRVERCILTDGVRLARGRSYAGVIVRRDDGTAGAGERVEDGVIVTPFQAS